jgi:hypothetical protein
MAVTRIKNNQITDSSAGNVYVGINASTKVQDYSITAGKIANSLVYGSDLTITGNLTVNGQTTTIDTVSTVIEDPVIVLAANQTGSPSVDIGFIGERGDSNNIAFVWDESADEFVTAFTTDLVTNTTITISSYANFHTNDANIGGNLVINGTTSLVGNITSALNVTGNITGGNLLTPGLILADGNITGSNLSAGSGTIVTTGNINGANVNATSGITAGTTIIATGNITGGNVDTAGQVVATGNITGGNVTTAGLTSTGTLAVSSTSSFTGNITSPFNVTGNIAGGNISTPGQINAVGNISGANINTTGVISTGTLETTGNALIGGNLIVQGNITYINIDDLRVEDPIIILGTGPNGAPLTVDDGLDRGIFMEYYTTGLGNAFMGWDNSSGNMVIAASAYFTANDVVGVNSYGTLEAGNLYIQSAVSTGNITGGNLSAGSGIISTTGNINGGNLNAVSGITASTGFFTGNVDVLGNLNATIGIVYANSGIFYGDAVTGNNAAFAGIPGFTPLGSNIVMQFAGNVNAYSQINFQNINSGNVASTDYIATADNGDDSNYYIDLGINSSTFDDPVNYPGFYPNDSYVHNHGGNLLLNPETAGTVIKLMVGGTANSDVISTVSEQGLYVDVGNLYTPNITSLSGRVTVNSGSDDVDFAVNGDTRANVLYIDAGTGTASFGNSTQTTGAIAAFNDPGSILMPVGNTAQRPGTGVLGMLRFNSTDDNLEIYSTAGWEAVGVPVFTVIADEQFNGDGSTVAFVLGSEQTTASCIVSINGVVQIPTVAYSVSGTGTSTLTFTEAPEPGDLIDVRQLTTTTSVTSISNTSGNAVIAPNSTIAQLDITGNLIPVSNVTYSLGSPTNFWNELYLSGNSIYLGDIILKSNAGNLKVRNFDDTADAAVEATFISTSTTSGNIQIGLNHIEVTNANGNLELRPNGTGSVVFFKDLTNGQANGVGNIGSSLTYFNTAFVKATSAQYADLAEKYVADAEYAPGTVLVFGGDKEVTVASTDADRAVAGVVSTNPSYIMNSGLDAEYVATVALTGRVPCRVTGTVRKGDLMVSAGYGLARADADPKVGTVIGKALESHEGNEGVIEVVVGRF